MTLNENIGTVKRCIMQILSHKMQNAVCCSHLGFTLQLGSINDKPLHSVLFLMYISENKKYIKTQQYFLYFDVKYKPPASSTFSKCSDENQGIVIFS